MSLLNRGARRFQIVNSFAPTPGSLSRRSNCSARYFPTTTALPTSALRDCLTFLDFFLAGTSTSTVFECSESSSFPGRESTAPASQPPGNVDSPVIHEKAKHNREEQKRGTDGHSQHPRWHDALAFLFRSAQRHCHLKTPHRQLPTKTRQLICMHASNFPSPSLAAFC